LNRLSQWPFLLMIVAYTAFWLWAAWSPVDRFGWFLENLLIILFLVVFIFLHRSFSFSYFAYFCIFLFLTLHTIGAHYSYRTPIDPWLRQWFELDRAYYDRVVHFSFGLFLVIPIKEWYEQIIKVPPKMYAFISVLTIFSAGAFYELIEMWVTMIVAPEAGATFIGIQGDQWDTQHDMELALYGSILMILFAFVLKQIKTKISRSNPSSISNQNNSHKDQIL
jgi:putative membrane protein